MASINQLLQDIEDSPEGPQIAAIFDFDGTIIAGYSAVAFIREQVRRGDLAPRELVELVRAMSNFGLGNLGFSGMMAVNAQFMRGIEEETYHDVGKQLYTKQIARLIYPESRALVNAHLAKGHTVAIISSATPYQVEPAAADLGIDHVLCTHLEVADGKFTGGVVSPTCFGQGKVDAAESLAEKYGADLDDSFFYSDSTDDLQLLERVGHPKALNPSSKLARVAHDKQWPVARFGSRGRPSVTQFIRSVAATSSLVTSFVAGLPILALTGSRRDSQNFSFSLFADTASALIGMDLDVKGEEHLWSHRPAVFVFNHQSKADIIIVAKLIRQDIAGIGKQEIKKETPDSRHGAGTGRRGIYRPGGCQERHPRHVATGGCDEKGGKVGGNGPGGHPYRLPQNGAIQERRLPPGDAGRRADGARRYPQRGRCGAQG